MPGVLAQQASAELSRRSALAGQELAAWKKAVEENRGGLGIHASQMKAIDAMMTGLVARQEAAIARVTAATSRAEHAAAYIDAVDEIVGGQDIWRIFRAAMAHHEDPTLKDHVDAAALVAADCYRACMARANSFDAQSKRPLRAPPLIYLDAADSPLAALRGETFGSQLDVRRYRGVRLPVPILLLPADHAGCVWLHGSLYHEVAHTLAQDLGLEAPLKQRVLDRIDPARSDAWWRWTGEILADAIGVQLGGAGYAYMIAAWLLVLAHSGRRDEPDDSAKHPNPHVRLHLLCAMLESLRIPALAGDVTELREGIAALSRPAWVDPLLADVDAVLEIFLDAKLDELNRHTVRELAPFGDAEADYHNKLADFLRTGARRPAPRAVGIPHRAVPAAAQLALARADAPDAKLLDDVQGRALQYIKDIERPTYLAAGATAQLERFYEALVAQLDFRHHRGA